MALLTLVNNATSNMGVQGSVWSSLVHCPCFFLSGNWAISKPICLCAGFSCWNGNFSINKYLLSICCVFDTLLGTGVRGTCKLEVLPFGNTLRIVLPSWHGNADGCGVMWHWLEDDQNCDRIQSATRIGGGRPQVADTHRAQYTRTCYNLKKFVPNVTLKMEVPSFSLDWSRAPSVSFFLFLSLCH